MRYFTKAQTKERTCTGWDWCDLLVTAVCSRVETKRDQRSEANKIFFLNWWFMMIAFTFPGVFVELTGLWDATSHDCSCSEHNVTMTTDKMFPRFVIIWVYLGLKVNYEHVFNYNTCHEMDTTFWSQILTLTHFFEVVLLQSRSQSNAYFSSRGAKFGRHSCCNPVTCWFTPDICGWPQSRLFLS